MHTRLGNPFFLSKYDMNRRGSISEHELDLVLASQLSEREAQTEYERASLHPAYRRGYDSPRWPFDIRRAIASAGYRRGIRRAMVNTFYNKQWRHAALWELHNIVDPVLREREAHSAAIINRMNEYYHI